MKACTKAGRCLAKAEATSKKSKRQPKAGIVIVLAAKNEKAR